MLMRSRVAESRAQPVTNLATNPSFETAAAGSTVVRRNLSPASVPFSDSVAISAFGTGGFTNPTISTPTDGPTVNGVRLAWRKVTATADAPSTSVAIYSNQGAALPLGMTAVIPGRTITASIYGATSITGASTSMRIRWFDSSYAAVSSAPNLDPWVSVAGTFRRFSSTAVVPANAAFASVDFFINTRNWLTGDWFGATGVLVEERPALLPFFNGSLGTINGIAYSFEGTANMSPSVAKAAVVEVRRNLVPEPVPVSGTTRWTSTGGGTGTTYTGTYQASGGPTGGAFYRTTKTADGTGSSWLRAGHNAAITAAAGNVFSVSGWVRHNASRQCLIIALWFDASNNALTETPSAGVTVAANTWTRISLANITPPANAAYLRLVIGPSAGAVSGDTVDAAMFLVEQSPVVGDYFDGNTTPDVDLTPVWTGPVSGSPSVLNGVVCAGALSNSVGFGKAILSTSYRNRGAASIRVIPDGGGNDNFVAPGGLSQSAFSFGMMPGKTYTALVTAYLPVAQTGSIRPVPRCIEAVYGTTIGSWTGAVYIRSTPFANVPGVYQLRLTFAIPTGAVWGGVRLYDGVAAGGGDVYFDDFMLVEGVYTGPYLDGDMPNCVWRGTAHAAPSVGYPAVT